MRKAIIALAMLLVTSMAGADNTLYPGAAWNNTTINGTFTVTTGPLTLSSGQLLLPDGTAAAPALAFSSQSQVGIWRQQSNVLVIGYGGVAQFGIGPSAGGLSIALGRPLAFGSSGTASEDVFLFRDTTATLALRNSTNAQTFNIYNTYTSASDYERFKISWGSNIVDLGVEAAGGGSSNRVIRFNTGNSVRFGIGVLPVTTDTVGLGTSTVYWQNLYLARSLAGSSTKDLTESSATTFVTIAVPQTALSNFAGGTVIYTVYETDGTDTTVVGGEAKFSAVNKAGTESCSAIIDSQTVNVSTAAKTLVCTITCVTGLSDVIGIAANCTDTASMTQSTLKIYYRVDMPQPNTVSPQ